MYRVARGPINRIFTIPAQILKNQGEKIARQMEAKYYLCHSEQDLGHKVMREPSEPMNCISELEIHTHMVPVVLDWDRSFLHRDLGPAGEVKNILLQSGSSRERLVQLSMPSYSPPSCFHFSYKKSM